MTDVDMYSTVGLPGDVEMYREGRGSVSTQQTVRTERFSEFLNPVDRSNYAILFISPILIMSIGKNPPFSYVYIVYRLQSSLLLCLYYL